MADFIEFIEHILTSATCLCSLETRLLPLLAVYVREVLGLTHSHLSLIVQAHPSAD